MDKDFDTIIIGGSYSGLSAAIALARFSRKVLVIDNDRPCNRTATQSNNFFTHDGDSPEVILAKAKKVLLHYPTVQTKTDTVVLAEKNGKGFNVQTLHGDSYFARKLIFATGVRDIFPDIKGFRECWGISVIHCPYCHGYELRGQKTAVLVNGAKGFQIAVLAHNITGQISIITKGVPEFSEDQRIRFESNGIAVTQKQVLRIAHQNGHVHALVFADGTAEDFTAVYAVPDLEQSCDIPRQMGCALTEADYILVDKARRTSVPGIFACGDCTTPMRSIAYAVSAGSMAGAAVNFELAEELF